MNHHAIANLARILACNARVEGMKAENAHRDACGQSVAYGEEAFLAEANELERLAQDTLTWGWQQ